MGKFFNKQKQIIPEYEPPKDLITAPFDKKAALEKIMDDISERAFVTTSPVTGESLDAIRTHDIYDILCEFFDQDPSSTPYSIYK